MARLIFLHSLSMPQGESFPCGFFVPIIKPREQCFFAAFLCLKKYIVACLLEQAFLYEGITAQ